MTNYPQQPQFSAPQGPQGMGESPLTDPSVRMILSMSPQDGSLRPLPADLQIQESADGTMNITYPDGSIRQLIPGAEGEGRMITTLTDGTRIQSDLTFGEGQVSVSSISSTGEKTLLSLNENGANMQRVTADGQVSSFIPDSAPELIESFREAEAFAQEQDFQQQEDFQSNQQYGEWNNYGNPADWQPEQNWQPTQGNYMPPQNFGPQFGGPEFGGPQGILDINGFPGLMPSVTEQLFNSGVDGGFERPSSAYEPERASQYISGNDFGRPDYAGNNWVDNGNGSWIAPIQPDAFPQPLSFQPPQQYGEWNNYGKPADWQPEQNWQPPQGNYMPSQNYGMPSAHQPSIAAAAWAPQSALFHQPEQNWQPPQGDFMPPQNFGPQFGGPEFGGPQPMPFAPMQPQHFGGNDFGRPDYAGNNWVDNGNGSWIAPVQPNAFQFPAIETQVPAPYSMGQSNINVVPGVESTNWQPPQGNYMQPQNFGPQYGGPQGIIDTNGYPQATPVIANGAWGTSAGHYDMKDFMQPPQPSDANGFFKPNPTDGSGFPFAPEANAPSFDGSSPIVEIVTSFDEAPNDEWNNPEQAPQQ